MRSPSQRNAVIGVGLASALFLTGCVKNYTYAELGDFLCDEDTYTISTRQEIDTSGAPVAGVDVETGVLVGAAFVKCDGTVANCKEEVQAYLARLARIQKESSSSSSGGSGGGGGGGGGYTDA